MSKNIDKRQLLYRKYNESYIRMEKTGSESEKAFRALFRKCFSVFNN